MNGKTAKLLRRAAKFETHADRSFKGGPVYDEITEDQANSGGSFLWKMVNGVKKFWRVRVWQPVDSTDSRGLYQPVKSGWNGMSRRQRRMERIKLLKSLSSAARR